jgi:nucleoid-associated protein YgaU
MVYAVPMNTNPYHTALLTLLAIGTFVLVGWIFVVTNTAHARFVCSGGTYTVEAGDTLYNIAIDRCEGNILNAIHHLERDNGGSLIHPGQTLTMPQQG